MATNSDEIKRHLREVLRATRAELTEFDDLHHQLIFRAVDQLAGIIGESALEPPIVVAGYSPIHTEPDARRIVLDLKTVLRQTIAHTALPRIEADDKPLSFRVYKDGDELVENSRFQVLEPKETVIAVRPLVVIVPVLGFDEVGGRLGYGAGFYDRTLQKLRADGKPLIAVGLAYEGQRVDEGVPRSTYDQLLDYVITERHTIDCAKNLQQGIMAR